MNCCCSSWGASAIPVMLLCKGEPGGAFKWGLESVWLLTLKQKKCCLFLCISCIFHCGQFSISCLLPWLVTNRAWLSCLVVQLCWLLIERVRHSPGSGPVHEDDAACWELPLVKLMKGKIPNSPPRPGRGGSQDQVALLSSSLL